MVSFFHPPGPPLISRPSGDGQKLMLITNKLAEYEINNPDYSSKKIMSHEKNEGFPAGER
jgi:hypothetical protein